MPESPSDQNRPAKETAQPAASPEVVAPAASAPASTSGSGAMGTAAATNKDQRAALEEMAVEAIEIAQQAARDISREATSTEQAHAVELPDFMNNGASASEAVGLGLLDDVTLRVKIELGRTQMYIEDVLRLNANSVVELDKAAGDPVDIYVNDRHVARGEVLVLNENFCVRISEIIQPVHDM